MGQDKVGHAQGRRPPGRPVSSRLPRSEQLRRAKRAQRERDRRQGYVLAQFKLSPETATLLRTAISIPGFDEELTDFLRDAVIDVELYPNLKLLCWNRSQRHIGAREAFGLYERNWRFVDARNMDPAERKLIARLTARYGNGVLNV